MSRTFRRWWLGPIGSWSRGSNGRTAAALTRRRRARGPSRRSSSTHRSPRWARTSSCRRSARSSSRIRSSIAGTPTGWSFTRASRTFQASFSTTHAGRRSRFPRDRSARSRRRRSCTAGATLSPSVAGMRCQSAAPRRSASRPVAERPGHRHGVARERTARLVPSAEAPLSFIQRVPATDSSAASSPSLWVGPKPIRMSAPPSGALLA